MISQAICNSYKREVLQGVHQGADVYMFALFTSAAALSKQTTAYDGAQEVSAEGYVAGGQALAGFTVVLDGDTACVDWTSDPEWPASTITARGALIYNASRENRAVAVLDFGRNIVSTNGLFRAPLPAPTATTAIVRIRS